jgi:hypothetical protein
LAILVLAYVAATKWHVQEQHKIAELTAGSARPAPSASLAGSPAPAASSSTNQATALSCLDESVILGITGKIYALQQENSLPEIQAVNCSYASTDSVKNETPSVEYVLRIEQNADSANKVWQTQFDTFSTKPGFRRIEEEKNLFAQINPVAEINQGSFYGFTDARYLELTYSPIQEATGPILDKGVKLAKAVLGQ